MKGTVAFEGAEEVKKIAGIAKIVLSKEDHKKVQFTDFIVTKMTDHDVAPLLKKVKGVITDEGSTTCHAAVVCREMGLPCIIATKNATSKLKDGDFLELDMKTGEINVIKKEAYEKLLEQEKEILLDKMEMKEEDLKEVTEKEKDMKSENILWFSHVNKDDVGLVGGKGASLGEMIDIFPIPNGFCITAQAYEKEVKQIQDQLMLYVNIDVEDTDKLANASKKIAELILNKGMTDKLKDEIIANYNKLGKGFVAVRSSATAEDLPEASFAGQQATFLNVKGEEKLIQAVKECWASLFTERAIYYRIINNFKHEDVLISVVIQQMVDSEKAGVMFTVNPVTKNYDELLIEGSNGLGETVVSGEVTPDSYFIDKKSLKVTQKHIAEKKWGLFRGENGDNVKKDVPNPNDQLLSEDELKELTEIGKKIEDHYGKPMDIEWAIHDGKLYILQARPITTL